MSDFLDQPRSVDLTDVGLATHVAAVVIAEDGSERLVLAEREAIADPAVVFDPNASAVHDQLGALPLAYVRRITVSRRTHRCGRPTQAGRPCRSPVGQGGDACARHRITTPERTERTDR